MTIILLLVGLFFVNKGLGICIGICGLFMYLVNKAEQVAYAQLYDFCNYTYEPATGVVELKGDKADKLISLL